MTITVEKNKDHPGSYDLVVDGKVEVEAEGWNICHSIKAAIEGQHLFRWNETDEVAAQIMKERRL